MSQHDRGFVEDSRMADTRKDKRAPVSLKVRFKSATVDEFIEHYSKDVSRGGIYIKSSNPMAVGTLLKFQFQLKDESALIKGVGRVVWTRAEVDATSDAPAGMGIKFIKMDDESRAMVERIIDVNAPDPGSYVSGRVNATSAEPTSSAPPPHSGGGNFFPDLPPAELPPPEDRTAVRHATQFLADALKEGTDEATAAEAAAKAEQAKKRQDEVEAQRKAEAEAAKKEEQVAPTPAIEAPAPDPEEAPSPSLPSMIIDPSLEPRQGRPSEAARETEVTPIPRPHAAFGRPGVDDGSEPDTEPPPAPPSQTLKTPTTSIPGSAPPPKRSVLPWLAIAAVIAVAAIVALRGGPEEKPVEEPVAEPIEPQPPAIVAAPEPAPAEPAPEITTDAEVAQEDKQPTAGVESAKASVEVSATPREAEVFVGGEKKGEGEVSIELPVGSESVITARAKGYLEATHSVTPVEGKRLATIKLKLKPLPFIVHVETTPAGAAINVAGVRGTTPADLTLDKPPTQELSVTAKLDGYERALTRIAPSSFSESDSAMRTQLNLTLKAKLPADTGKEASPEPPKHETKKPRRSEPRAAKPVESSAEPPKPEEAAPVAPSPAEAAPEPKAEPAPEPAAKPGEPLPTNPFGN
jgi:uncharacterized protein (TIGR02266 family)